MAAKRRAARSPGDKQPWRARGSWLPRASLRRRDAIVELLLCLYKINTSAVTGKSALHFGRLRCNASALARPVWKSQRSVSHFEPCWQPSVRIPLNWLQGPADRNFRLFGFSIHALSHAFSGSGHSPPPLPPGCLSLPPGLLDRRPRGARGSRMRRRDWSVAGEVRTSALYCARDCRQVPALPLFTAQYRVHMTANAMPGWIYACFVKNARNCFFCLKIKIEQNSNHSFDCSAGCDLCCLKPPPRGSPHGHGTGQPPNDSPPR